MGLSVQQVALWCVCVFVCVSVCVLRVCVCVCCVWDSLEQVWGMECAASGFVLCVCVFVIGCV